MKKYKKSVYFISSIAYVLLQYDADSGKYIWHDLRIKKTDIDKWVFSRHGQVLIENELFLVSCNANVIFIIDLNTLIVNKYVIPFHFKAYSIHKVDKEYWISSVDTSEVVIWDREKETYMRRHIADDSSMECCGISRIGDKVVLFPYNPQCIHYIDKKGKIHEEFISNERIGAYHFLFNDQSNRRVFAFNYLEQKMEVYDTLTEAREEHYLTLDDESARNIFLQEYPSLKSEILDESVIDIEGFFQILKYRVPIFNKMYMQSGIKIKQYIIESAGAKEGEYRNV